jgi:hypothetical protein
MFLVTLKIDSGDFELFKEGDKTRLRLTHAGLASFPSDLHFAGHRFEYGWNRYSEAILKITLQRILYTNF